MDDSDVLFFFKSPLHENKFHQLVAVDHPVDVLAEHH